MALCGCGIGDDHRCRDCPGSRLVRDRGRETSDALVAVRTVLSRAETALEEIERGNYVHYDNGRPVWDDGGEWIIAQDEDYDEMRHALESVVASLDRWRRIGRPRKS